jgi:hypothetical protein
VDSRLDHRGGRVGLDPVEDGVVDLRRVERRPDPIEETGIDDPRIGDDQGPLPALRSGDVADLLARSGAELDPDRKAERVLVHGITDWSRRRGSRVLPVQRVSLLVVASCVEVIGPV